MTAAAVRVAHLAVGPDEHGVVMHALDIARSCDQQVLRVLDWRAARDLSYDDFDVVHLAFTDRLFGPTCEEAVHAVASVGACIAESGAELSVTLHDVPHGDTELDQRRRRAYAAVVGGARGVVVNSRTELAAVQDMSFDAHSVRCIPLPIERVRPADPAGTRGTDGRDVVVLGFVFPDRGYEQVLAALPAGSGLTALGKAAVGHENLPDRLALLARHHGSTWRLTGFVPDAALAAYLEAAPVPVAPNRRVTASGSIGTWLAHGRRPIVPATPYTEELLDRMPGSVRRYDPDEPGALRQAIVAALRDPTSTRLPATTRLRPGPDEVAAAYRSHLAACASPRVLRVGRASDPMELVPGNRWDLLGDVGDVRCPQVSVVIPYYDDQRRLDLVLAGLRLQTWRRTLEVVVADDGSPVPPDLSAAGDLPARTVRQERQGFGAARARNLGAGVARGELLAFLDADTVPAPDYLERLLRLPRRHPRGLAVGRRRHADLGNWRPGQLDSWFCGGGPGPPALDEPDWLRRGYAASHDLRDAGPGAYRYVISAVIGLRREFFARLGGFDERFTAYGGEDWEFANRAWHAGALVKHEPDAQAWHDGPDWAGRPDAAHRQSKNTEILQLARLLPDPGLRGHGQWLPYPHIVVRTALTDPAQVLACVRSAFAAGVDCGVWLVAPGAGSTTAQLADPRVHAGSPPPDVTARAAVVADMSAACDLSELAALADLALRHGMVSSPAIVVRAARAVSCCAGVPDTDSAEVDEHIGRLFGRHDRSSPAPWRDVRLQDALPRCAPVAPRRS